MKKLFTLFICIILLVSCKTYTVSPEKFKEQLMNIDQNKKEVSVNNPLLTFSTIKYSANNLKYLNVYDKEGNLFFMQNSPSVEMRVTLKNGKRKIFYLDTVFIENDTLKGQMSRIMKLNSKVSLSDISKIEVQDGKKNYQYN